MFKKTYRPEELAKHLGVNKRTLLYWEEMGYVTRAHRFNNLKRSRYWTGDQAEEIYQFRLTR
jgi:DNA-binding transcriptional MerR regulator